MDNGDFHNTIKVISDSKNLLISGSSNVEDYQLLLSPLSKIVSLSGESEEFRETLNSNREVSNDFEEILTKSFGGDISYNEDSSFYIRLMRGILLLIRNIVTSSHQIDFNQVLSIKQKLNQRVPFSHPYYSKTITVYLQCVANMTQGSHVPNAILKVNETIFKDEELMILIDQDEQTRLPLLMCIKNLFQNSDNLYDIMTHDDTILNYLVNQFDSVDVHSETIDKYAYLLVLAFQNVVAHESYNKWLKRIDIDTSEFTKIMKLNQIIVTSKDDWDNYQLAAILAWTFDYFKIFSEKSQKALVAQEHDANKLENIHLNLVILLDCLSDLGKYEATNQFLEHYNAIEELINLLRVVHENVERKTLKSENKITEIGNKKNFPQAKSLIIEIIAYLVHNSFELKEKVRELHGLELILSNCMIDDNNPFIKERAIVCLKFLLANNEKNQKFVADLEAKQSIDDNALKEVGYEVEIDNGKVKLKQTEESKRNSTD